MDVRTLSIVVPCLNEQKTLPLILQRVIEAERASLDLELIVVDDGSDDDSYEVAQAIASEDPRIKLERHEKNQGKGAALRTGFAAATGDIVMVQDADLEYDPVDYPRLLEPILHGDADVVYGSRFRGGQPWRLVYYSHSIANRLLTALSNMLTNINFSDMECGYKVFRREVLERIELKEDRFGIEPEITAKICKLRPRVRIYEVGIRYWGRTYEEGKKIGLGDGLRALYCIVRYNLLP